MNSSAVLLFILSFGHMCVDITQGALPALLQEESEDVHQALILARMVLALSLIHI